MTSGLPRTFWWLWTGLLISSLATFVFPFLTLYLTSRGFDAQQTGLLVSLLGVGAIAAGPLAGTIADRYGRRPAILFALIGSSAAAAWLAFAARPVLVAPGVLVFGLCAAMAYPSVNATMADVLPPNDVQRGFALLYWAMNLGVGVSAVIGGLMATKSWLALFLADAATTLLFAVLVWRRIPESRPAPGAGAPRGWAVVLGDRAFLAFVATMLAFLLVFWQFQFALPIAMARAGLGSGAFGIALAANCALILVTQAPAAKLVARFDEGRLLAAASLLLGAGYGAYTLCTTMPQYVAATLVWTLAEVVGMPAAAALVAKLAPVDLRGRYQGAYGLCTSAAMTLAPILGGSIIQRAGLRALWMTCSCLCAAAAALHLSLAAARRRIAVAPG